MIVVIYFFQKNSIFFLYYSNINFAEFVISNTNFLCYINNDIIEINLTIPDLIILDISSTNRVIISTTDSSKDPCIFNIILVLSLHMSYAKYGHFIQPYSTLDFDKSIGYRIVVEAKINNFVTIVYPLFYSNLFNIFISV